MIMLSEIENQILAEIAGNQYDFQNLTQFTRPAQSLNLLERPGHSLQHEFSFSLETQLKEDYGDKVINILSRKIGINTQYFGYGELREFLAPDWYSTTFIDWARIKLQNILQGNSDIPDHIFDKSSKRLAEVVGLNMTGMIIPFIGAGVSANYGFPTWRDFLLRLAMSAGIEPKVTEYLNTGKFELAAESILNILGLRGFYEQFSLVFKKYPNIDGFLTSLKNYNSYGFITTNYDHLLERMFNNGINILANSQEELTYHHIKQKLPFTEINQFISNIQNEYRSLLKLHGDLTTHEGRILTKTDYDNAYGDNSSIDFQKPLPKGLSDLYKSYNFLFIGCSLEDDRTMKLFEDIQCDLSHKHYAFMIWENEEKQIERERFLNDRGIFPIYFSKDFHNGYGFLGHLVQFSSANISIFLENHPTWMHAVSSTPSGGNY